MSWFAWLEPIIQDGTYLATFTILVLCGVGLPVPEEATFLVSGYVLSKMPDPRLWLLITLGMIGILIGDTMIYYLGRWYGMALLGYWPFRLLFTPARMAKAQGFFDRHGDKAALLAGFFAGIRACTFFLCGVMRVRYPVFIFYDFVRAGLTCPISIWIGFRFGEAGVEVLAQNKHWVLVLVVIVVVVMSIMRRGTAGRATESESGGPEH